MAGIPNLNDQRYLIDRDGNPVGGTLFFYYSGTSNLAPIYSDVDLTVRYANPITVAAGSPIPTVYLDNEIVYRRLITYVDGTSNYDIDPYNAVNANAYLPLSGGTISGNLTVTGTFTGNRLIGTSPNSGTNGGVIVKDAPGSPDVAYLQFTNNTGSTQYGYIRGKADGTFELSGAFSTIVKAPASTTLAASLNIPAGTAPTTPNNGDIWGTTAGGLFTRINGVTEQILSVAASSLATNGYVKLNNGLIIQWGVTSAYSGEGGQTITFPIAFPTACLVAVATADLVGPSDTQDAFAQIYATTTTSMGIYMQETGSGSVTWGMSADWIAIGY